jgi:lysine 6-dehydrogenase
MKRILVLGGGLVGGAIARELARDPEIAVTVADSLPETLDRVSSRAPIATVRADLASGVEIGRLAAQTDAVVGALPGRLGFGMLQAVLSAGKPIADISFSSEDPLGLDDLAKSRGSTAVVDCGVSPGISNFAMGRAAAELDEISDATIFVGGLPFDRGRPGEYAIVFSAIDVIEEYTRPARLVVNGRIVTRPALSDVEMVDVPGVGRLEAFLTDGLRTLLTTVPARNMREKTLRYPGHAGCMRVMRDTGFFAGQPIEIDGGSVVPRALTERLLFQAWQLHPGEEEFTFLRVDVRGRRAGRETRRVFELFDRTDPVTGLTSMARTTGFPCAVVAGMLARGEYRDPGVRPLEFLARQPAAADRFGYLLRQRGIVWTEKVE